MTIDDKEKSILSEYLNQNKEEAAGLIPPPANSELAPIGKRIWAYTIDKFVLFGVSASIFILVKTPDLPLLKWGLTFVADFVYAGYFYSNHAATPGKMAFSLQVVRENGARVDFLRGGLRDSIGKYLSGILFGIGYIMVLFRSDRHALHDLIFKTKVLKLPQN